MNIQGCTSEFDSDIEQIQGLAWLPWVGSDWSTRPKERRLLVVGESHYASGKTDEEFARCFHDYNTNRYSTREVVSESFVDNDWETPTTRNIPKLLFGDGVVDRSRFWRHAGYYNFVQRAMNGPEHERPEVEDFKSGWSVCFQIIQILQPSICVFIGVTASKYLEYGMLRAGLQMSTLELRGKVNKTHGRRASLDLGAGQVEMAFVRHAGSYFSWQGWNAYLQTEHPDLMRWLDNEGYTTAKDSS